MLCPTLNGRFVPEADILAPAEKYRSRANSALRLRLWALLRR
jgi:hypothetical protein